MEKEMWVTYSFTRKVFMKEHQVGPSTYEIQKMMRVMLHDENLELVVDMVEEV